MRVFFFLAVLMLFIICIELRIIREECEGLCDEERLMNYLAIIQVLTPESVVNLAIDELDSLCRRLDENTKLINKYLKSCRAPHSGDLYMSLISGVRILNIKMCSAGSEFLQRFMPFYPCLHELQADYDGCNGPADWNEETDEAKLCLSYKHIVDCYYVKTAKVCGINAAVTLKELITDVIDKIICVKCKGIDANPYVKDVMPEQYIKRNQVSAKGKTKKIYINMIVIFVLILLGLL